MIRALRLLPLLLVLGAPLATAAPYLNAWDFDDAAGLDFDPAKIVVADGVAQLRPNVLATGDALSINVVSLGQHAAISTTQQSGLDLGADGFLFVTWVKLRNTSANHSIFNKREVVNGFTVGALMQLVPAEAGYQVRVLLGTASRELEFNSSPAIRDTAWHQLGLAVDRAQDRAQLYLDGKPFGGVWTISALDGGLDSSGSFLLGIDSPGSQLRGDLDEVHFWRFPAGATPDFDALVASHFDDAATDTTNLVSIWRFDEGTGDDSFGPNDLTLAGSPGFLPGVITRYAADSPFLETSCQSGGGSDLYTVDHVLTAPPERAEIRYQLSGDGVNWWRFDPASGWTAAVAASASQASLLYQLRENLPDAPFATGSLCLRAFFLSDGLYSTGLDRLELVGPPPVLALVAQTAAGRPAPGSFHVIFETDYPAEAFIEYRNPAAGPAATWLATPVSTGGTVFGIDVTGLDPAADYEYRARFRARGASHEYAASIAKVLRVAPVTNAMADIEFAVWGDSRPPGADPLQPQAFYRLMQEIAGRGPVFHVAVGDNVNLSGSLPFGEESAIDYYRGWRDAYDIAGGTGYMFFALGNHDEGVFEPARTIAANARLRATVQPTDGDPLQRYYSWRWGDALFAAMDGSFINPKPPQLVWLYQTLRQPARWKFVFNHYPVFNSARGVSDIAVRNDLHANFLATGVNIVFQAHDHWYADAVVNDIHYTTSGGGGSTLTPGNAQFGAIGEYHYLRVRLEQYAATVRAIKINEDGTAGPELDRYCVRAHDAPWDNADTDEETNVCDEDDDDDGAPDTADNCRLVTNSNQRDTDGDGYGNICDADFDNSGVVNSADLARFRQAFGTGSADHDLNGSGSVNAADLALFRALFGAPPGPAGAD